MRISTELKTIIYIIYIVIILASLGEALCGSLARLNPSSSTNEAFHDSISASYYRIQERGQDTCHSRSSSKASYYQWRCGSCFN